LPSLCAHPTPKPLIGVLNSAARRYWAPEPELALVDTQTGVSYSTSS